MTVRGTALLLLVLLVLAAGLWLGERRSAPDAGAAPLLAPSGVAPGRIELREPGRTFTAVRRDGGWVDAAGRPWTSAPVDGLLETLRTLHPIMVVDAAPRDLADYGLDAPAALAVVAADGHALVTLDIGARNPAGTNLYARVGGRPEVVLLGAVLAWELDKLRAAAPGPLTSSP